MRRRLLSAALVASLLGSAACGSDGDDRPTDEAWAPVWATERDRVPDAAALVAGGEDLCGELTGELRSARERLLPTPTEALDDTVRKWTTDAVSLTFDCPVGDEEELDERLDDLAVLSAEIDAGLAVDASQE